MSSIQLGSDALAVTPGAGQLEFNGTIATLSPTATTRGVIPCEQFFMLNAGLAGANATGAQNIFGVGVTLSASTIYEFEMVFPLSKSAGTTAHTLAIGFGGTATINNINYWGFSEFEPNFAWTGTPGNMGSFYTQAATATVVSPSSATAVLTRNIVAKGIVSINAGGTFIPQYTLSAAPGGAYTTQAGSYMKIKPIGAAGANVSVGTWL